MSLRQLSHLALIGAVTAALEVGAAETVHALKYPEYVVWLLWAVIVPICFWLCVVTGRPKRQLSN